MNTTTPALALALVGVVPLGVTFGIATSTRSLAASGSSMATSDDR